VDARCAEKLVEDGVDDVDVDDDDDNNVPARRVDALAA
jgi:hypothetical protein